MISFSSGICSILINYFLLIIMNGVNQQMITALILLATFFLIPTVLMQHLTEVNERVVRYTKKILSIQLHRFNSEKNTYMAKYNKIASNCASQSAFTYFNITSISGRLGMKMFLGMVINVIRMISNQRRWEIAQSLRTLKKFNVDVDASDYLAVHHDNDSVANFTIGPAV